MDIVAVNVDSLREKPVPGITWTANRDLDSETATRFRKEGFSAVVPLPEVLLR